MSDLCPICGHDIDGHELRADGACDTYICLTLESENPTMTERITPRDVQDAFANHVDTLERYGITYDGHLVLSQGSKTYGNAWRINRIPTGETGHWAPPIGSDFLGMTAREAYDTLCERTRTMHDMAQALGLPRFETTRDREMAS